MRRPRPMAEIIDDLNKAKDRQVSLDCRLAFLKGIVVGIVVMLITMGLLAL